MPSEQTKQETSNKYHIEIRLISGPIELDLTKNEAVVLCLVKNGEVYIDEFIDYYHNIGFSHVVILDNGSTDHTVQRAMKHNKKVTVIQSLEDYKTRKVAMKDTLVHLFGHGTWSLIADIDEFFQYPFMDSVPLNKFLTYLNENKFTSLVSHLLDMVPDSTLDEICQENINTIQSAEWYFDYSNIDKYPYPVKSNIVTNPEIKWWYGGIRKTLFEMPTVCLSKHPLNFGDSKIHTVSGHVMGNRCVADISGLLLHYKYLGNVYGRTCQAVIEKNYFKESKEYKVYLEKFKNDKDQRFTSPNCIKYVNHQTIINHNLFTLSEQYIEYASKISNC